MKKQLKNPNFVSFTFSKATQWAGLVLASAGLILSPMFDSPG